MVITMKIFDRFRQKEETVESEAPLAEAAGAQTPDEMSADVGDIAPVEEQTEEHTETSASAEGEIAAESTPDSDIRIADERYELLRSELAAARDEMRRRELEYFALSLLAEEKMSPKLCTMVQGETEEEISRNVEAIRSAVREEVQRLRGSGDRTPPTAGKAAVSPSAIKKLSLRELKNIMG